MMDLDCERKYLEAAGEKPRTGLLKSAWENAMMVWCNAWEAAKKIGIHGSIQVPLKIKISGQEWQLFCVDLAAGEFPPTIYIHARDIDHALSIMGDLPIISRDMRTMTNYGQ